MSLNFDTGFTPPNDPNSVANIFDNIFNNSTADLNPAFDTSLNNQALPEMTGGVVFQQPSTAPVATYSQKANAQVPNTDINLNSAPAAAPAPNSPNFVGPPAPSSSSSSFNFSPQLQTSSQGSSSGSQSSIADIVKSGTSSIDQTSQQVIDSLVSATSQTDSSTRSNSTTDTTSSSTTNSTSQQVFNIDNLTPTERAALDSTIATLQANQSAGTQQRTDALNTLVGIQAGGLDRNQAIADSSGLLNQALQQLQEGPLAQMLSQAAGSGSSTNALNGLLSNDLLTRAAAAVGAQTATNVANYENIGVQQRLGASNAINSLLSIQDPATQQLVQALGVASGAGKFGTVDGSSSSITNGSSRAKTSTDSSTKSNTTGTTQTNSTTTGSLKQSGKTGSNSKSTGSSNSNSNSSGTKTQPNTDPFRTLQGA